MHISKEHVMFSEEALVICGIHAASPGCSIPAAQKFDTMTL
jgi:hypothetical protein